jgi:phenylacetate-coenzyme A ligase PaaK-like adenylate-forming protein
LIARDRWSRVRLLDHQRSRLRQQLAHATSTSRYYRETLGADAADRPLSRLPTLPKATLVEQWDRIVTDSRLRLVDVEAHTAGATASSPYLDEFRVVCTSGASGLRGLFVYDRHDWEVWLAVHLRLFSRIGIGADTRLVAIGAPGPVHLTRQLFAGLQRARSDAPRLSVVTPLDEIVTALNAYQPQALIGYPTIGALLADEQLAGRLNVRLRVTGFGGEPMTDDIRDRISAAWGIRPANFYATTEAPLVATSTPTHPDALELGEDMLIVEIVDQDNQPVAPGAPGAKVLITSLVGRALPLIRYELSDRVTPAEPPNPAGRPYRCIAAIEGRAADTLRLPARGGGEIDVMPYRLGAPFAQTPGVSQYQLLWDGTELHVRLVLTTTAAPHTVAHVAASISDALTAAGAVAPPIRVQTVTALEREPGPAAKLKLIKSLTPPGAPGSHDDASGARHLLAARD